MVMKWFCFFLSFCVFTSICFQTTLSNSIDGLDLLVVTVATEETDGFIRFKKSVDVLGHDLLVLGMNEEWQGGDVRVSVGGAHKINLMKQGLAQYKDKDNLVIFFTDSYDVIFAADKEEILTKFVSKNAKLIFSAESTVWPDKSLKNKYPSVKEGYPYLCSGGIIGYASTLWQALNAWQVANTDDDQLYYTLIYLNETLRFDLNMTLDHKADLIQNLNFAQHEVEVTEIENYSRLRNERFMTLPCVIHGNGPSKVVLNRIGNYVPRGWHSDYGCRHCDKNLLHLTLDKMPLLQIAIFISTPAPFIKEFFDRIAALSYPKSQINIFIHNQMESAEKHVHRFLLQYRNEYNEVFDLDIHSNFDDVSARNLATKRAIDDGCEYQFSINANIQLFNPNTITYLMRQNKKIIAPLLNRDRTNWANFWGALNEDGYYLRSDDYLSIVHQERIGIWNVAYIAEAYLLKTEMLKWIESRTSSLDLYSGYYESDMNFCQHLRNEGVFMYVTNQLKFGRTLLADKVVEGAAHPDLWQIFSNPTDWESKYLHPKFWDTVQLSMEDIRQPCPDVFMFPLFTEQMADAIVDTMNEFGSWSSGSNEDDRISGGYENVPTRDIHMNQVGYEKEWLHMLATYPSRIVEKVYPGFYTKAHSIMMFVVRYKPDEQPFLRPHHDASTWTMNVALNSHGTDFEGGGCRFIRYNCSIIGIPKGYALIHPGRLTHYHEGLYTTKGTRYIAVSFVDP